MTEVGEKTDRRGGGLGSASLWLGLFGLALALPPTITFFVVPGYWVAVMGITSYAAPVLAIGAVGTGVLARRGPRSAQAKAGMWLGLIALACLGALVLRIRALLGPGGIGDLW